MTDHRLPSYEAWRLGPPTLVKVFLFSCDPPVGLMVQRKPRQQVLGVPEWALHASLGMLSTNPLWVSGL